MSIYTKIYTLDKILRKVENNNTVILTDKKKDCCLFTAEFTTVILLLEIYSEKFNFLVLFLLPNSLDPLR